MTDTWVRSPSSLECEGGQGQVLYCGVSACCSGCGMRLDRKKEAEERSKMGSNRCDVTFDRSVPSMTKRPQ